MLSISAEVEVALIQTSALDGRREILRIREHEAGELLVLLIIARHHDELGADLPGARRGHWRVHAHLPGLVAGRSDDTAFLATHGHGLAAQLAIGSLLDAGEERIRVEMDDHGGSCSSFAHDGA